MLQAEQQINMSHCLRHLVWSGPVEPDQSDKLIQYFLEIILKRPNLCKRDRGAGYAILLIQTNNEQWTTVITKLIIYNNLSSLASW